MSEYLALAAVGAVFVGGFVYLNVEEYVLADSNLNRLVNQNHSPYRALQLVQNAREKTGRNFVYYLGKFGRERAYKRFRKTYGLH